jgi:structural maintenance of chromosome 4
LARVSELDAVTQERDEVRRQYEDIRKQRLDEFMQGFTLISTKLKEMYQVRLTETNFYRSFVF